MPSSGMLRRVALVTTDVSEEIRLLVTDNVPSSPILVTLSMETLTSSKSRFLQQPRGVTSQKTPFFKSSWAFLCQRAGIELSRNSG
jgi:hypothetical protein